jgi:hypothetical protein
MCAVMSLSSGCTVAQFAAGDNGVDLTAVQPSITQAHAEAVLGPAVNEWKATSRVIYRVYEYDAGRAPRIADAVAFGIMDVISLSLREAFEALANATGDSRSMKRYIDEHRTTARVVISCDENDVIFGVFDEFEELPVDGRAKPSR